MQTRDGSEWLFCDRCGYHLRPFPLIDRIKSKNIQIEMRAFVEKEKFREPLELYGYCKDWTEDRIKAEVERILKQGIEMFKKSKAGKFMYRKREKKGYGAYTFRDNEKGFGSAGRLPSDPDKGQKAIQSLRDSRNDNFSVKITEILENGEIKELVI